MSNIIKMQYNLRLCITILKTKIKNWKIYLKNQANLLATEVLCIFYILFYSGLCAKYSHYNCFDIEDSTDEIQDKNVQGPQKFITVKLSSSCHDCMNKKNLEMFLKFLIQELLIQICIGITRILQKCLERSQVYMGLIHQIFLCFSQLVTRLSCF